MPYKILYASDLHGNKDFYNKLIKKAKEKEIQALIIGGDLAPKSPGTLEQAVNYQKEFFENFFIPQLSKLNKPVFFIMGNDDFRANGPIFKKLNKRSNLKYIHQEKSPFSDKAIVGYSFVNPTPFRLKDWEKFEDEKKEMPKQLFGYEVRTVQKEEGTIKQDLKNLVKLSSPKKTVYVIHAPPFNTKLDIIASGAHVGSKAIRAFIEKEQPFLTLHGHIHESPRMSGSFMGRIGKTICINVGSSYPENKLNSVIIDIKNLDLEYIEL